MGIPPSFGDLGKAAKDLFEKNFHFGIVKAEHKSKILSSVDLTTSGTHNIDTGKISGSLEAKYKLPQYKLTFTEKLTTSNVLTTELAFDELLFKGMKQTFEATYEVNTSKKSAKGKTSYKREALNANVDFDFQKQWPQLNTSLVLGYKGFLAGANLVYDTQAKNLSKVNGGIGYQINDFALTGQVLNYDLISISIYQRLTDNVETALSLNWAQAVNTSKFGVVTRYQIDKNSFFKAKIDNSGVLGLAYSFDVRSGVALTLGAQMDAKNLNAGGHKLGLGVEFS